MLILDCLIYPLSNVCFHPIWLDFGTSWLGSKLLVAAITSYICGFFTPSFTGLAPIMGFKPTTISTPYGLQFIYAFTMTFTRNFNHPDKTEYYKAHILEFLYLSSFHIYCKSIICLLMVSGKILKGSYY